MSFYDKDKDIFHNFGTEGKAVTGIADIDETGMLIIAAGESALDFIRKIRFKEACRLLKDGRYSISEISDLVGFNTPSYFATCFKKYLGCLPTEYVKNLK